MSSRPDRLLSAVPPFAIFTHDCQSYEQNIPYVLIRSLLRHLFTFDKPENLDSEPQSTASAALLEQIGAEVQNLAAPFVRFTPLLGDVLNVALPETPLTQSLTPEQRYHRLQELLVALLLGVARREPLLLSLENIQWADEPSREVLGRLSRAMHQVPLLLLVNYRPSPPIDQPWKGDASTVLLELSELSQEKSIDMLTALLGGPPPPAILPLLERTQGNPLYIEELMRTLVISGALIRNGGGQWHLARPLDQAAIPSSIQGLIVARLDSLPESRYELVQTASVIGRRFQHHILSRVYDSPSLLDESLHDLIRDEIVLTDSLRYDGDYLFRHAMVCDVAYEAVLYARRRELHLRVATCVEMLHTIKTDETLALLARHYLLAEVWEPAFHYHMAAGKQAQRRYANRDALALFATAIDIVLRIQAADETHSMFEQVIELHERSGDISMLLGETDQAEQSYLNALVLLNQWRKEHGLWRTEQDRRFMLPAPFAEINIRLHRLMASLEEQRSNYDSAFDWLDRGVSWSTDDTRRELARCYLLGTRIYYRQGNFNRSLDWAQRGLALAESLGTTEDQALALRLIGVLWSDLGEFGNSLKALERARVLWDQVHDVNGLNKILNDLGTVYNDMSRLGDAIACYEQSLQISENIADAHAIASTSNNLAVVLVKRGELQRADELYRYSGEQYRRIGSAWGIALTDYNQGEVLLLQQRPAEALELFQSSIAAFERMQARTFLPEVLRLAAEASLALGQADQAHDYAEQSYTLANDLGMTVEAAVALRALGQVALWRQDFPGAQSYLECSRVALEQSDNRYELGRLLLAEARLAHATGQQHIISALRQAADIFTALDAQFDLNMVYTHAMSYGIEPGKLGNLTRPSDGNDGNPPHS
jgi:tetratricopeptide (TPR) repeat protein